MGRNSESVACVINVLTMHTPESSPWQREEHTHVH
jgi:hypothetical protein